MSELAQYVSCAEYCAELDNYIRSRIEKCGSCFDAPNFPWDERLFSDHLPVVHVSPYGVIVAWNVLNRKYIKYLQPNAANDNQRLGYHPMSLPDKLHQLERERGVCAFMREMYSLATGAIFCLQEVSYTLLELLRAAFADKHLVLCTQTNMATAEAPFDNCNVVIVPTSRFEYISSSVAIPPEIDRSTQQQFKSANLYYTLRNSKTGDVFNVVSVHLSFSSSVNFVAHFLALNTPHPTIIAGDFNRGVRYPVPKSGMHMQVYADPRFRFPNPKLFMKAENGYSHVCYYENVGKVASMMLERYDHVILLESVIKHE